MEQFFALTPDSGAGEMPRLQALETVRNNIEWMQRNKDEIEGWLQKIEWTTLKLSEWARVYSGKKEDKPHFVWSWSIRHRCGWHINWIRRNEDDLQMSKHNYNSQKGNMNMIQLNHQRISECNTQHHSLPKHLYQWLDLAVVKSIQWHQTLSFWNWWEWPFFKLH